MALLGLCLIVGACLARVHVQRPADPLAAAFGEMPALSNVRLSPSGSKVSFLSAHSSGIPIAIVWEFDGGAPRIVLASEKNDFEVSWCDWANEERLLCGFTSVRKRFGALLPITRLVAVDSDGSNMKVLRQRKLEWGFTQFQADIVDWLPDDPKHVLIQVPDRTGTGVSKLNIYTGSTRNLAGARRSVFKWKSDGRGALRLRMSLTEREVKWRYRIAGENKWRVLHESKVTDLLDVYEPAGFGSDPNQLLVYKPFEGKVALWSEDLANDRVTRVVFAHPAVDVQGAQYLGKFNRMVAVGYSTDRNHLHFFDDDVERISSRISALYPNHSVQVADESWDQRFYLVRISADRAAGSYFRFDSEKNVLQKIADQHPHLGDSSLAPMKTISYAARDGEQIPGYLTLPTSAADGPVPGVVLPHGGPQSRDYWGYDWLAQFLAARGYAVLQSNYRGSGGFGEDWSGEGGFRNWRVAIDDITDGTRHLVESGVVAADRICILGWSYGGYAALLSAVEEPELYRCVVSIAGVTDLNMLIADARDFVGGRAVSEFVGKDGAVRTRGSPASRAAEFAAPVLLFHGNEDLNVRIGHSKKMAKALRKKKKQVELIEYEEVEHSIRRSEFRIDMLTRIGAFLDHNTAPRISGR